MRLLFVGVMRLMVNEDLCPYSIHMHVDKIERKLFKIIDLFGIKEV